MAERQISAYVSDETRRLMDEYAQAHGLKKGHLIEAAILHHLQALRDLPADIIVPPRVVVSRRSMEMIAELLERPQAPTEELRDLLG